MAPSHISSCRHVKALESRSQLLDAALASADEANRRWEDCRALVDQLRIENAALRAALNQLQQQAHTGIAIPLPVIAGAPQNTQPAATQQPGANGTNVPSASSGTSAEPADDNNNVPADQAKDREEAAKETPAN